MISFKQLDTGAPKDILAITDDANAELAEWTEMFENDDEDIEYQAAANLAAATERDADGNITFIIPGDEAGEIADLSMELADFLDELNEKAIADAEAKDA